MKWLVQVVTWGSTILVMRLLTPEDYGLFGMAMLFLGVVTLVSEFGIGSAIVALRELTARQIAQLNTVAVLIGFSGLALSVAVAGAVGDFFAAPRLPAIIHVLSATFLMSALIAVPQAILRRDLRYRTLALVEGGQTVGAAGVTLFLAWHGLGYWSLVLGRLAELTIATLTLLLITRRRFARPRLNELREPLLFSSHVITSRLAWYAYSNADYLIAGKLLGQGALGLYTAAFTLARLPAEKIAGMVTRVTPGIFSAAQKDSPALRRYVLLLTEGIALITFPPIIGLALVAPGLIPLVLGEAWVGAVLPLQILSFGAALRAVTPLLPQILNVVQETRFGMRVSLVGAAVFMGGFYLASAWGIAGIALAWVLMDPVVIALPVLWKVRQRIGLSLRQYFGALWPAASACGVMAAMVLAVRAGFSGTLAPPLLLAAEVGTGALSYSIFVLCVHRAQLDRIGRALRLLRR